MDDIGDRQIVETGATQPLHMLRREVDRRRAERNRKDAERGYGDQP